MFPIVAALLLDNGRMHPLHPVKENNPFGLWCLGCESFLSKRDDGYIVMGNMDNDEYARLELRAVTPGNAECETGSASGAGQRTCHVSFDGTCFKTVKP
ncbi:hypothetical protein BG000_005038 [Podila horticola]|nr:hypothetical protein BG000_005038 [Podila horticola]